MIALTKLDNTRVLITLETIKYVEETPDTLVRFLNGESLIVKESLDQIEKLVMNMRRSWMNDTGSSRVTSEEKNSDSAFASHQ